MEMMRTPLVRILRYDSAGRLIKVAYGENSPHSLVANYEYNTAGQVSKQTFISYFQPDSPSEEYIYHYNAKGQIQRYSFVRDQQRDEVTCEYDAAGYRTKYTITTTFTLHPDKQDTRMYTCTYAGGNLLKRVEQFSSGLGKVETYEYYPNRLNKLQAYETTFYSPLHSPTIGTTPSRNMLKSITHTYPDGFDPTYKLVLNLSYEFDSEGFPVKTTTAPVSNGTPTVTFETLLEGSCPNK